MFTRAHLAGLPGHLAGPVPPARHPVTLEHLPAAEVVRVELDAALPCHVSCEISDVPRETCPHLAVRLVVRHLAIVDPELKLQPLLHNTEVSSR